MLPGSPDCGWRLDDVYEWVGGNLMQVPTLTEDDRQLLLESASCLNAGLIPVRSSAPASPQGFDDRVSWDQILVPLSWKKVQDFGEVARLAHSRKNEARLLRCQWNWLGSRFALHDGNGQGLHEIRSVCVVPLWWGLSRKPGQFGAASSSFSLGDSSRNSLSERNQDDTASPGFLHHADHGRAATFSAPGNQVFSADRPTRIWN